MENYLFIINPVAGNYSKAALLNAIGRISLSKKLNYSVVYTEGLDDEHRILYYIDLLKPRKVIVCGGDGTINMVAGLLTGSKIPLGIIPVGSANGLAAELRIPDDLKTALEICFSGNDMAIDAIILNGKHYSFHLSDLGFNARIINEFEKIGERGLIAYAKAFFLSLKEKSTALYSIQANGSTVTTPAEMVVIANAARYGTGAVVSPHSKINDGTFELVIFKPIPLSELLHLTLAAFLGSLENSPYVDIIKTTKATIKTEKPQYFQVDGQVLEKASEVEIEILKKAVHVIAPSNISGKK